MRPSKQIYYLEMAKSVSLRSTCMKNQCGVVIVKNDVVVSTGYNGAPRGRTNCIDLNECYRIKNNIPSGVMYEKCLDGESRILLADMSTLPLRILAGMPDISLPEILSMKFRPGKYAQFIKTKPHSATKTRKVDDLLKISFEDSDDYGALYCTPDHKIPLTVGDYTTPLREVQYVQAQELKYGNIVPGAYLLFDDAMTKHILSTNFKVSNTRIVDNTDYEKWVYDLEVPETECFFVETAPGTYILVHNCRSVHGEQNAIIAADRDKMIGSTMYIYQYDLIGNCVRKNPGSCQLCQRMIINAGINEVVFADPDGLNYSDEFGYGIRVAKVQDWVDNDTEEPIG